MSAPATINTPGRAARAAKELPVTFGGPAGDGYVRAILSGQKTVVRAPVALHQFRPSTTRGYDWTWRGRAPMKTLAQQLRHPRGCWQDVRTADLLKLSPFGLPGDRLWVREAWAPCPCDCDLIFYREKFKAGGYPLAPHAPRAWLPAVRMPRPASRLTLRVTDVRVERLHAIDEADARREGVDAVPVADVPRRGVLSRHDDFVQLWQKAHGRHAPWESDPWVWRVAFEVAAGGAR